MGVCSAKWCAIGLLCVIACLVQVKADDKTQPTVNECRVHVEAALKQYWSHSPAPQELKRKEEDPPVTADEAAASIGGDQETADDQRQSQEQDEDTDDEDEQGEDSPIKEQSDDDDTDDDEDKHDGDDDEPNEAIETGKEQPDEDSDDDDDKTEEQVKQEDDDTEDEKADDDDKDDEKTDEDDGDEKDDDKTDDEKVDDDKSDDEKGDDKSDDEAEEEKKRVEAATEDEKDDDEDYATDSDDDDEAQDSTPDGEATTEESPEDGGGAGVEQELPAKEPAPEEPQGKDQVEEVGDDDDSDEDEPAKEEQPETTKDAAEEEDQSDDSDNEPEQPEAAANDDDTEDDEDDDDEIPTKVLFIRNRQHIDDILGLDDIGTESDADESYLVTSVLKDLKKSYETAVKPMEGLYKFRDMSNRVLGDAELFGNPMVLLIGPWSSGKSSIINYLLGVERTPQALKTGPEPTDTKFTVVTYGEKAELVSGTEMAVDWPFSTVQKFGQAFLDHFRGVRLPHRLLKKVTFVDTPGIIETRKQQDKGYPFNEAFQWFIDRADAIYITFDPAKLEIGSELEAILDQLKGREAQIRFILNKADTIRRSDVMRVTGQLFWNLSPLLGSSEAPVIYTVSLMTKPFHPGSPARFLLEQEKGFLHDIRVTMDKRVENRIAYARRHAVRVRNHAKMVDCYLATYYRHKSIFSNRKVVAESITENPNQYSIYAGLSALTNVSRYDLPDPDVYKVFFRLNPLYDFKPLSATCSYFKGCPLDKLDISIAYDLPELLGKYKKRTKIQLAEWDEEKGR